jgi:hypothetical protein
MILPLVNPKLSTFIMSRLFTSTNLPIEIEYRLTIYANKR